MKNRKIIALSSMILILMGISCTEDFLTPKPLSFYAPENTFIDANGLNAALIACLRNARHEMYGDSPQFISEGIFSDIAV
jgi:hypothetical protein